MLWGSFAVLFALLVAPGAWDATFAGAPLGWYGRVVLVGLVVAVGWALIFRTTRDASTRVLWSLVALVVLKLAVGSMDGPTGWLGSYVLTDLAPPRTAPFFERLKQRPYRVDPAIDFEGREFRLHFLNDVERFNTSAIGRNRTEALAFEMTWSTWFDVQRRQTLTIHVQADSDVAVHLDGRPLDLAPADRGWMASADVIPREHQIVVTYRKPAETRAAISAQVRLDGDPPALRAFAHRHPLGRRAAFFSDGMVLLGLALMLHQLWLAFGAGRPQPRLEASVASGLTAWLACVYIAISAFAAAQGDIWVTVDLGAGDDPLAYVSNARNILEEGLLMPVGKALGSGSPYFFYPLYSYALAAVHSFVGEDYGAVRLFNGLCSVALPLIFWGMGWRKLGLLAQGLGMVVLSWLIVRHSGWYWQAALTDNLFIPLAIGAVWLAGLSFRADLRRGFAFAAGIVSALAGSTRPSFLLFVGAYVLTMLVLARPLAVRERLLRIALFVGAYAFVLAPFVMRNYVMSGQAVMVVTLSHAITVALIPPEGGITAPAMMSMPPTWFEALGAAWQMFLAEPWLLIWLEVRKVLFTLGFTNMGPAVITLQYEFPVLLVLCIAGLRARVLPRWFLLTFGAFFVSHLTAMVIAYPWTYGYKTILPVQYLFLFCALYVSTVVSGWWQHRSLGNVSEASGKPG